MKFFEKFRGMFAVIKKEFARFFLDRRMLLTTVIMPGLLIYVVYSLMGTIMGGIAGGASSYTAVVDSMPQSLTGIFSSVDALEITAAEEDSDVDVMILLDLPREQLPAHRRAAARIAADLLDEYGVVVSPLLESEAFFARNRTTYPFFRNIDREGIRYVA